MATPSLSFNCPVCPAQPGEYCTSIEDGRVLEFAHPSRRAFKTDVAFQKEES